MVYLLQGTRNADTIRGGAGHDSIVGLGGADSLSGGAGNDSFAFATAAELAAAVLVDGGTGTDTVRIAGNVIGGLNLSRVARIEQLVLAGTGIQSLTLAAGSEAAFTDGRIGITAASAASLVLNAGVIGSAGSLTATGTRNADVMIGTAGGDLLIGSGGADFLMAGAGNDRFEFSGLAQLAAAALVDGDEGTDAVRLTGNAAGTLTLANVTNIESLELAGTGPQYLFVAAGTGDAFTGGTVDIKALGATLTSINGSTLAAGSRLSVTGGTGTDIFAGSGGDDVFAGGGGADQLLGNAGNDTFVFGSLASLLGAAAVNGGTGADTLRITGEVNGTLAQGKLLDLEAIELTGSGDLSLALHATLPKAFAGGTISLAAPNANSLVLNASALARGALLTASGGAGQDRFIAGAASETLTGGAGDDRFEFKAGSGSDVITDFQAHTQLAPAVTTITFDEFGYTGNTYLGYSNYQGFTWSNAYVSSADWNGNLNNAATSGRDVMTLSYYDYYSYSSAAYSSSVEMSRATSFDLLSLDVTALPSSYNYSSAWVWIYGYDAQGSMVASQAFNQSYGPSHVVLNDSFQNLSRVTLGKNYGQVAIDSITVRETGPTGDLARDKLVFAGYSQAQVEQMIAEAGEINGDTYLFYNDGLDQVVLKGVEVAQLSLTDFVWG